MTVNTASETDNVALYSTGLQKADRHKKWRPSFYSPRLACWYANVRFGDLCHLGNMKVQVRFSTACLVMTFDWVWHRYVHDGRSVHYCVHDGRCWPRMHSSTIPGLGNASLFGIYDMKPRLKTFFWMCQVTLFDWGVSTDTRTRWLFWIAQLLYKLQLTGQHAAY